MFNFTSSTHCLDIQPGFDYAFHQFTAKVEYSFAKHLYTLTASECIKSGRDIPASLGVGKFELAWSTLDISATSEVYDTIQEARSVFMALVANFCGRTTIAHNDFIDAERYQ